MTLQQVMMMLINLHRGKDRGHDQGHSLAPAQVPAHQADQALVHLVHHVRDLAPDLGLDPEAERGLGPLGLGPGLAPGTDIADDTGTEAPPVAGQGHSPAADDTADHGQGHEILKELYNQDIFATKPCIKHYCL